MPRIRMCDEDRARYGGPEWVEISLAELEDEETGLIEQIELQWDITPEELIPRIQRGSMIATRAMIWAARYKTGIRESAKTFRPKVLNTSGIRYEHLPGERGDVDPPEPTPVPNRASRRATKAAKPAASGGRGRAKAAASPT